MKTPALRLIFAILLLAWAADPALAGGQKKDQKKKKNSDVENIGDRNINKGNINFISIEKEIALGRQLAAEVERQVKIVDDPVISEYVNRMYKSGYDPSAFVTFFEKLQAREKGKQVSKMFQTHPPTADRVAAAKENIENVLAQREEYVVTTSEFAGIQERLTGLEARNLEPQQDENRPALKRKTPSRETGASKTEDGEKTSPDTDDRPKLKRH